MTSRKAAAGAEARLAAFLANMPEPVLVVDGDGRIALANPAALALFGYQETGLVGSELEVLLPEAERRAHRETRSRYARHPCDRAMGQGLGIVARRRDGTCFPADIELRPRSTEMGSLTLAVIRDLTPGAHSAEEAGSAMERRLRFVELLSEDLALLLARLVALLESGGHEGLGPEDPATRIAEAESVARAAARLNARIADCARESAG